MKATEQYFQLALFLPLSKIVLAFGCEENLSVWPLEWRLTKSSFTWYGSLSCCCGYHRWKLQDQTSLIPTYTPEWNITLWNWTVVPENRRTQAEPRIPVCLIQGPAPKPLGHQHLFLTIWNANYLTKLSSHLCLESLGHPRTTSKPHG